MYPKVPGGCDTSYIKCAHGVPYDSPCEAGLSYDEKNHACNWPDLLLEVCNPERKKILELFMLNTINILYETVNINEIYNDRNRWIPMP